LPAVVEGEKGYKDVEDSLTLAYAQMVNEVPSVLPEAARRRA